MKKWIIAAAGVALALFIWFFTCSEKKAPMAMATLPQTDKVMRGDLRVKTCQLPRIRRILAASDSSRQHNGQYTHTWCVFSHAISP